MLELKSRVKINDLELLKILSYVNIAWLDVSVTDLVPVNIVNTRHQLPHQSLYGLF